MAEYHQLRLYRQLGNEVTAQKVEVFSEETVIHFLRFTLRLDTGVFIYVCIPIGKLFVYFGRSLQYLDIFHALLSIFPNI